MTDRPPVSGEPRTGAGRQLLNDLVQHVRDLAPTEADAMRAAATDSILAIEAEATPRADAPPLRAALIGLLNALNVYERNWLTSTTGYGKVAEAAKQARTALSAPATPAESVAVAWAEAEAALPDDWELSLSFGTFGSRTGYHALAEYAHSLRYYRQHVGPSRSIPSVTGDGLTPEAALCVLAARLRAEQEGEGRPRCTRARHDEHCADLHWESVSGASGGSVAVQSREGQS